MQAYDALIFDLGGVVINLDTSRTITALAQSLGVSPNTLWQALQADEDFLAYERGQISDDDFLSVLENFTPRPVTREQLVAGWNAMLLDIPPERIALIKQLAQNHRLFVLSNTNGIHIDGFNEILLQATGYQSLADIGVFEHIYYSYEVGMRKPDQEIYQYVVDHAGLDPARSLFMDDNPDNLVGAQSVGLQVAHMTPTHTLLELFA